MKSVVLFALVVVVACGKSTDRAPSPGAAPDHYTARGRVSALPAGEHSPSIEITTEAIPAFKAADGRVAPMEPMPMSYAIGPGVVLAGIAVGDPVELTFETRWDAPNPLWATRVVELPADTKLALP